MRTLIIVTCLFACVAGWAQEWGVPGDDTSLLTGVASPGNEAAIAFGLQPRILDRDIEVAINSRFSVNVVWVDRSGEVWEHSISSEPVVIVAYIGDDRPVLKSDGFFYAISEGDCYLLALLVLNPGQENEMRWTQACKVSVRAMTLR